MKSQGDETGIDGLPASRWADIGGPVHFVEWPGPEPARKTANATRARARTRARAGPVFICVHGLGGSHINWVAVGSGLAQHGRVVALDLAGFGFTPRAGRSSSLMANRALVGEFIRNVAGEGASPVFLVGNSMGGALAILQAAIEPESVAGIVLSSPAVPWAPGGWPSAQVFAGFLMYRLPYVGDVAGKIRAQGLDAERAVRIGFRLTAARPETLDPSVIRMHVEMARRRRMDPDSGPAFIEAARSILRLGARPEVARRAMDAVTCPVLMMHGDKDRLVPVEFADAAAARETAWTYRRFEDIGHVIQIENPDLWLATTGDWLGSLGV